MPTLLNFYFDRLRDLSLGRFGLEPGRFELKQTKVYFYQVVTYASAGGWT